MSGDYNRVVGSISPKSSLNASISSEVELSATINGIIKTIIEDNYNNLKNLPSINNIVIKGNLELNELGISEVIFKEYSTQFPNIGSNKNIYIAEKENKTYRWDENNLKYYIIGSDYNDIKVINGGNANG